MLENEGIGNQDVNEKSNRLKPIHSNKVKWQLFFVSELNNEL